MAAFGKATAVTPDDHVPGRFHASVPETWSSPVGLHGGVFAATVARAAELVHRVDGLTFRSLHARYLERPSSGELIIDTDVLRTGGISAFVEASSRAEGQERMALRVGALFTRPKGGDGYLDAVHPDVPPVEDCEVQPMFVSSGGDGAGDGADGAPGVGGAPVGLTPPPLFDQLEIRPALGDLPWDPAWTPDQPARFVRWGRFHERPELADGGLDPLAMLVYADLPAPALWVRLTPDDPFHAIVSLELSFHVLERPTDEWLCVDSRARWMGDGYLFTETDLWSAGRLCAVSSQMMLVRMIA